MHRKKCSRKPFFHLCCTIKTRNGTTPWPDQGWSCTPRRQNNSRFRFCFFFFLRCEKETANHCLNVQHCQIQDQHPASTEMTLLCLKSWIRCVTTGMAGVEGSSVPWLFEEGTNLYTRSHFTVGWGHNSKWNCLFVYEYIKLSDSWVSLHHRAVEVGFFLIRVKLPTRLRVLKIYYVHSVIDRWVIKSNLIRKYV